MQTQVITISGFWRELAQKTAQVLLLVGLVLMPLSTHWMNQFLITSAIISLFGWGWTERATSLRQHRSVIYTVIFFAVAVIGVFYSAGSTYHALHGLSVYAKLFYLIIFLPLFTERRFRDMAIGAFLLGIFCAVLIVLFGVTEKTLVNEIDTSFMAGFACFILARRFLDGGNWRWVYAALFIFMACFMLVYNVQRTGYLVFFAMMAVLFWQSFRWRGLFAGLLLLLVATVSLYSFFPKFQHRISEGYTQAMQYSPNNVKGDNSIGLRVAFVDYSWQAIKPHLIFGNGTGSFIDVYKTTGGPFIGGGGLSHPHNQYVMILFQFGLVGLFLFLLWQWSIYRESLQLPRDEQRLLEALLVSFILLGVCNVSFDVSPSGELFIIFTAAFLSSKTLTVRKSIQ